MFAFSQSPPRPLFSRTFLLLSRFSSVLTTVCPVPDSPTRSTWLGASRFAANKEEFRKIAITRQEYQEHGSSWAGRKFAGM